MKPHLPHFVFNPCYPSMNPCCLLVEPMFCRVYPNIRQSSSFTSAEQTLLCVFRSIQASSFSGWLRCFSSTCFTCGFHRCVLSSEMASLDLPRLCSFSSFSSSSSLSLPSPSPTKAPEKFSRTEDVKSTDSVITPTGYRITSGTTKIGTESEAV